MKRPRIYGNDARCRTAVARYINGADELLEQGEGVKKRIATLTEDRDPVELLGEFHAIGAQSDWEKDLRQWFNRARRGMNRYLQEQLEDVLPILAAGLPPETGKPRHSISLENGVTWLAAARDELEKFQAALGVRRGVTAEAPAPARFEELYASGLVGERVIEDHAKEMRAPHTPRQLYNAIGAAKEVTEATLRAALDQLGEPYRPRDELAVLMKKWRTAIHRQAPPDPQGVATLDRAQAALANLVQFLAEWRNAYGRGHGRPEYPPGLKARHARLAADAAETCVRFIVTTMDDLQLLPP